MMENKKRQKLSVAALAVSVLPLATFIPTLLKITLIISSIISAFWVLMILEIVVLALCLNFLQ